MLTRTHPNRTEPHYFDVVAHDDGSLSFDRAGDGVEAAGRIAGTLGKDLVKTPDHELWPHV